MMKLPADLVTIEVPKDPMPGIERSAPWRVPTWEEPILAIDIGDLGIDEAAIFSLSVPFAGKEMMVSNWHHVAGSIYEIALTPRL